MKNPTRVFPLLLLAGVVACQGDHDATDATDGSQVADSASDAPAPAPAVSEEPEGERRLVASFDLPAGKIVSIRLQPTTAPRGQVAFSQLALVSGDQRTEIDLCADKRLQLVRSTKVQAAGEGCVIEFGNGTANGWIAPSQLRNLPASNEPRRLEVAASGELAPEFRVYLDVGNGYGSRDMLRAGSEGPAVTGAGG